MSRLDIPDLEVRVGGVPMPCLDAEISLNNQLEAGAFRVSLAAGGASNGTLWSALQPGSSASEIAVEIRMSLGSTTRLASPWTSLITGFADHIMYDPLRGVIEIDGRDQVARLIALPVSDSFVNQTASEIVIALARTAGLACIATPTATIVGQYYQIEHARSGLNAYARFSTAWDVICHLAQSEGYDCWVAQGTLFFQPPSPLANASLTLDFARITMGQGSAAPCRNLRLQRRADLMSARAVSVRSWNSCQRSAVSASYPPGAKGDAAPFVFVAPNLTDDGALARAEALYRDIIRHRQIVSGEMAGDLVLMPRGTIEIIGTDGGWDGAYAVDSVIRDISVHHGFNQSFVAHLA